MALRYFTLSSSLCAETIGGAWEVRLEKNTERVRAMLGISFYLYEVGSARAPKGFPWWTAGMKIDPRVPNTLIRKDYSIVNFTNIYSVSTQIRYLSKPQKWYSIRRLKKPGLHVAVPLTSQVGSRSPTAPSETPPPPPETLFLSFFFSIFKELPFY